MIQENEMMILAIRSIQYYVNNCRCENANDAGAALMKLLSVASSALEEIQGPEVATASLQWLILSLPQPENGAEEWNKPTSTDKMCLLH